MFPIVVIANTKCKFHVIVEMIEVVISERVGKPPGRFSGAM